MGGSERGSSPGIALRAAIACLLAVLLLVWFLWGVDLRDLLDRIRQAHAGLLLAALVFALAHFFLRAWRWRYLLLPLGEAGYLDRLQSTVAGYAVNNTLPARGGEIARPYLLHRRTGLPFAGALATVVLERLLDTATVAFLFVSAAPFVVARAQADTVPLLRPILLLTGLFGVGVLSWLAFRWQGGRLRLAGGWILGFLPSAIRLRVQSSAATFLEGFSALGRGRLLLLVILSSFVLWLDVGLATWCAVRAFEIPFSYAGALFLAGWLAVGMVAPTPAGVGGYHAACRYALTGFFAVDSAAAAGVGLVLHALSVIPVTLWGLVVLWTEGLHLTGWQTETPADPSAESAAAPPPTDPDEEGQGPPPPDPH